MRQRLIDRVGPNPVLHSWGYADAFLRAPEVRAPLPQPTFLRSTRTGLWVPLQCVVTPTLSVYKATDSTGTGTGIVTTSSFTPTAGATLMAFTRDGSTNTVLSVTQGVGANVFTQRAHDETADPSCAVWTCENVSATAGAAICTFSSTVTNYSWLAIVQIAGVDAASFDTAGTKHAASATALLSSSITTAVSIEAVVMASAQNAFATYTAHTDSAGNTWTLLIGNIHDAGGNYGGIEYFVTASALSADVAQMTSDTNAVYTTVWSAAKSTGGATRGLFRTPPMAGVGIGGSFFRDALQ